MKKLVVFLSLLLLSGCSSITVLRTKEIRAVTDEVKKNREEMTQLRQELDSLRLEQDRLQKRMKADMSMLTSRVVEESERMVSRMEENQYRLDLLIGKSDKILSKRVVVEKRITSTPQAAGGNGPAAPGMSPGGTTGMSPGANAGGEETTVKTLFDVDMEKIYNTAKADFHKNEFKLAYDGFKQVYEKKSGTQLAENALYWMGLCQLEAGSVKNARTLFDRLLQEFPQGGKSCVTMWRLADLAKKNNDSAAQTEYLKKLTSAGHCSGTNEAMKAAAELQALSPAPGQM